MYLYDYHIHSLNSKDAKSTISELCVYAIEAKLKEIAITDHFEPVSDNENSSDYDFKSYYYEMMKVKSIFSEKLKINFAVELGQPHLFPESSQKLIESHPYDFVLASVHRLSDGTDLGSVPYNTDNLNLYCDRYLDELKSLAKWNQFDCVGHLDLVKRYAANFNLRVNLMDYRERLEEILKIIIGNGKGIEVNTSGLRQSAGETLPGPEIIKLYKQLGGEIITVGSDAHIARDVGKGIREGLELIEHAGFNYVTVYSKRQPSMIKISKRYPDNDISKKTA